MSSIQKKKMNNKVQCLKKMNNKAQCPSCSSLVHTRKIIKILVNDEEQHQTVCYSCFPKCIYHKKPKLESKIYQFRTCTSCKQYICDKCPAIGPFSGACNFCLDLFLVKTTISENVNPMIPDALIDIIAGYIYSGKKEKQKKKRTFNQYGTKKEIL